MECCLELEGILRRQTEGPVVPERILRLEIDERRLTAKAVARVRWRVARGEGRHKNWFPLEGVLPVGRTEIAFHTASGWVVLSLR
jgi:hypothetical protein